MVSCGKGSIVKLYVQNMHLPESAWTGCNRFLVNTSFTNLHLLDIDSSKPLSVFCRDEIKPE